jgi:hypothetical protein
MACSEKAKIHGWPAFAGQDDLVFVGNGAGITL